MKILAISSSSNTASVALLEDSSCIKELNIFDEKTHSEKLLPLIDSLLKETNTSLSDIELISCDIGPGSFTGIRIGVSTVKGLADFNNIKVIGCSSLEGLAYNATNFEYVCSILDARNNQVYAAIFDKNYNLVSDYMADDINTLLPIFQTYHNLVYVGDGKHLLGISNNFDDTVHSMNIGICGYKKYLQGQFCTSESLVPLYLRKSQAERLKNG